MFPVELSGVVEVLARSGVISQLSADHAHAMSVGGDLRRLLLEDGVQVSRSSEVLLLFGLEGGAVLVGGGSLTGDHGYRGKFG